MRSRDEVKALVDAERQLQDDKWGSQRNHHPYKWLTILMEEVGEAAEATLEGDLTNFEREVVQAAAVCFCILENG